MLLSCMQKHIYQCTAVQWGRGLIFALCLLDGEGNKALARSKCQYMENVYYCISHLGHVLFLGQFIINGGHFVKSGDK